MTRALIHACTCMSDPVEPKFLGRNLIRKEIHVSVQWGTLCTLHLNLIVAFYYDRYEVPPVILVLIPLTHWSTWSNSPWMTDFIS